MKLGEIPVTLRSAWQPTPVFLPGESPWTEVPGRLQSMGHKVSDMTERLSTAQHRQSYYTNKGTTAEVKRFSRCYLTGVLVIFMRQYLFANL